MDTGSEKYGHGHILAEKIIKMGRSRLASYIEAQLTEKYAMILGNPLCGSKRPL